MEESGQISRRTFLTASLAATAGSVLASGANAAELVAGNDDIKLYILDNGFAGPITASLMYQLEENEEDHLIDIPYWSALITTPQGNVIFDTGCNDTERQTAGFAETLHLEPHQRFPECLEPTGIAPDQIDHVVVSHFHGDHFGYMDMFPNATIHVASREFASAAKALGAGEFMCPGDLEYFLGLGLGYDLIADNAFETPLLDGLTMYNFGAGHSYAMIGLMVELSETGAVLLPSDAVNMARYVADENPLLPPERSYDYEGAVGTIEVIRQLAEEKGAEVWPAHDMEWFNGMTKAVDGYYA